MPKRCRVLFGIGIGELRRVECVEKLAAKFQIRDFVRPWQAEPHHRDGRAVGSDRREGGVPEADMAGANDEVERSRRDRGEADQHADIVEELVLGERRLRGRLGRKLAERRYDARQQAETIAAIYRHLVERSQRSELPGAV